MVREIKFRAWDKKYGKLFTVEEIYWDYKNDKLAFKYILGTEWFWNEEGGSEGGKTHDADGKNIDLMQYTGLKDENGKEVYEGDVLINKTSKTEPTKVWWNEHHGGFFLGSFPMGEHYIPAWGVIGNIHENPELLEGHSEEI